MPHSGQPRVYVMRCGRMYKIGYAIDPMARLKELSTGSAYPIVLWKVFLCEDASRVERWLHRAAKPYRGNGGREWFELPLWFTGWLAKQTSDTLDDMARRGEQPHIAPALPPPHYAKREEFVQCRHCGRSARHKVLGDQYCYRCQPLADRLNLLLSNEK